METLVLVGVIILAIAVGARWIHLLNAQHDARIAVYHFSDPLPRPPGLPDDTGRGTDLPPAGGSGRGAPAPRPVDRGTHSDET
ncbi:hypothetical protein AB0F18_22830 [Streptomyces sp. NPDC029216]|uniref:hypothetical protein n=1 Tax=Streptomyces sp. NPDC029216 TaxID=3154701 RepID=UPI0033CE822E